MGRKNRKKIYPTITFPEICRKLGLNARQRVVLIRYYKKEVVKMEDEEKKVETPELETDVEEETTEESAETEATPGTESEE